MLKYLMILPNKHSCHGLPLIDHRAMRGFTLIELSIVLVIIGLITGGVFVGRDLISGAAVRAQISQIEKYQAAVNTFRGKYGYFPGDIPAPYATQYGFVARGIYPAQGDGNGQIQGATWNGNNDYYGWAEFGGETAVFWADLSKSHLIEGDFSTAGNYMTAPPGVELGPKDIPPFFPAARIAQGNYVYVWSGGWGEAWFSGQSDRKNYFGLSGVIGGVVGSTYSNVALTVQQAYSIDNKIDDGMPQTGRVLALHDGFDRYWASGGGADNTGATVMGDCDWDSGGPITSQTVSPFYASEWGVAPQDTCYSNGDTLNPEQYSMEYNNGQSMNCALSFQFQ
jgi:prepilin-type N-terminal cleavage/methylation domain-containing protein